VQATQAQEAKDAAEEKARKAEATLVAETTDAAMDARVQKRLANQRAAEEAEKRRAAVAKAYPTVDLEGKSGDFIDGLFAGIKEGDGVSELLGSGAPAAPSTESPGAPQKTARERMLERNMKLARGGKDEDC